jgi:non-heme chloroperoxidase
MEFFDTGPDGGAPHEVLVNSLWRQSTMGGTNPAFMGVVAFSQTDFTEDLKRITVPVLVMQGDDDEVARWPHSAPLSAELFRHGTLKTYPGHPHVPTTQHETINADLLRFFQS